MSNMLSCTDFIVMVFLVFGTPNLVLVVAVNINGTSATTAKAKLKLIKSSFLANGCIASYGPYNVDCLNSLWLATGCTENGGLYPERLPVEDRENYNIKTTYELRDFFRSLQKSASVGNVEAQLNCYGLVFPDGCRDFYGAHSIDCMESIWFNVGCAEEGNKYPFKLSSIQLEKVLSWTLLELNNYIYNIKMRSSLNDLQAQMDCYGLEFFRSCTIFEAPLSLQCLHELWTEKAGCTTDGYSYPSINSNILSSVWLKKNQRDALLLMNEMRKEALSLNKTAQEACYGLVFPVGCTNFYEDHSLECLRSIWEETGCSLHGKYEPGKLEENELEELQSVSQKVLFDQFTAWSTAADNFQVGNIDAQLSCFGLMLSSSCPSYHGSLSVDCLTSIWLDAGCTRQGVRAPFKLTETEKTEDWKDFNLHEATSVATSIYNAAVRHDDILRKLDCLGIPPIDCELDAELLSDLCLDRIWLQIGCKKSGIGYPFTLYNPFDYNAHWVDYSLRDAILIVKRSKEAALDGNVEEQLRCFGKVFPAKCSKFEPPHSRNCLLSLWEEQGCTTEGYEYFEKVANSNNLDLNIYDLREIALRVRGLLDIATSNSVAVIEGEISASPFGLNLSAHYSCFGLGLKVFLRGLFSADDVIKRPGKRHCLNKSKDLPNDCFVVHGPHSVACYRQIWTAIGCLEDGAGYTEVQVINSLVFFERLGFHEIVDYVQNLRTEADALNVKAQELCYGFEFPSLCLRFDGPHDLDCVNNIKILCGFQADLRPLTEAVEKVIENLNLKELIELIKNSSGTFGIDNANETACPTQIPPLSIDCFAFIWEFRVGCLNSGLKYPSNLNMTENYKRWGNRTVDEVASAMQIIRDCAQSDDIDAQLNCFGFKFRNNCPDFDPPLTIKCLNTIWAEEGCTEKGLRYPGNLNTSQYMDTWSDKNQLDAMLIIRNIYAEAAKLNMIFRDQCYGKIQPTWIQAVSAAAVNSIMFIFAGFLVFVLLYVLIRLIGHLPLDYYKNTFDSDQKKKIQV